ncbi:MAG: hypothetical protein GY950_00770 [bacterium]|nr:hypothetical protein [bacterium]
MGGFTQAAYEQYNSQYKGKKESIGWLYWDTLPYVSAATLQLVFFNLQRATLDLSNMTLGGQLPAPNAFLFRGLRFFLKQRPRSTAKAALGAVQPGAIDNIQQLINTGVLQFLIGAKEYGPYPLWMIPSGGGAFGVIASDGDVASPGEIQDYAISGIPDARNSLTLAVPIFIAPQINFSATLTWPAAIVLAGGDTNISIGIEGDLIRPVQ